MGLFLHVAGGDRGSPLRQLRGPWVKVTVPFTPGLSFCPLASPTTTPGMVTPAPAWVPQVPPQTYQIGNSGKQAGDLAALLEHGPQPRHPPARHPLWLSTACRIKPSSRCPLHPQPHGPFYGVENEARETAESAEGPSHPSLGRLGGGDPAPRQPWWGCWGTDALLSPSAPLSPLLSHGHSQAHLMGEGQMRHQT